MDKIINEIKITQKDFEEIIKNLLSIIERKDKIIEELSEKITEEERNQLLDFTKKENSPKRKWGTNQSAATEKVDKLAGLDDFKIDEPNLKKSVLLLNEEKKEDSDLDFKLDDFDFDFDLSTLEKVDNFEKEREK